MLTIIPMGQTLSYQRHTIPILHIAPYYVPYKHVHKLDHFKQVLPHTD